MTRETNLAILLRKMKSMLNDGDYGFCTCMDLMGISVKDAFVFRKDEGITIVPEKKVADNLGLSYSFAASWITLTVHSSLDAVGLTAAFSTALSRMELVVM